MPEQPESTAAYRHPRLNELAALQQGWDSYGAPPITEAALRAADTVTFVPTNDGGVQVEIHTNGQEVEVVFDKAGAIEDVWLSKVSVNADGEWTSDESPPQVTAAP